MENGLLTPEGVALVNNCLRFVAIAGLGLGISGGIFMFIQSLSKNSQSKPTHTIDRIGRHGTLH